MSNLHTYTITAPWCRRPKQPYTLSLPVGHAHTSGSYSEARGVRVRRVQVGFVECTAHLGVIEQQLEHFDGGPNLAHAKRCYVSTDVQKSLESATASPGTRSAARVAVRDVPETREAYTRSDTLPQSRSGSAVAPPTSQVVP